MTLEQLREEWNASLSLPAPPCAKCVDARVWRNGMRWRTATLWLETGAEFVTDIPVRRLRCSRCKRRWCVAAEGVPERAHYQPCVVAQAVAADACGDAPSGEVAKSFRCHVRSLWRMVERVARLLSGDLAGMVMNAAGEPVLPARHALRVRRSDRRATEAERSMAALWLLEALAGHRGLAPPGLAHVGRLMPEMAGRVRREVAASMPA